VKDVEPQDLRTGASSVFWDVAILVLLLSWTTKISKNGQSKDYAD
jgi:hypothetical protein